MNYTHRKKERKAKGLPPNKYFERLWELTMNPETGKPEPRKALLLQNELSKSKADFFLAQPDVLKFLNFNLKYQGIFLQYQEDHQS